MDRFFNEFFSMGLKVFLFSEKEIDAYLAAVAKNNALDVEETKTLKKNILLRLKEEKKTLKLLVAKENRKIIQENDSLNERVRKIERYLDENAKKPG